MLPVPVPRSPGKTQDDDVGPVFADHPNHVGKQMFAAPLLQSFRGCLRKSEIDSPGEKLFGAIDASRGQQFLRADDSERRALLGADEVLSALTARC
jgi:hypothetical protein